MTPAERKILALQAQLKRMRASEAVLVERNAELLEALRRADEFIANGISLGFIRMPDADTPDPAHQTPAIVRAVIAQHGGAS